MKEFYIKLMEKKEEKIPLIDDMEQLFYDSTQQS